MLPIDRYAHLNRWRDWSSLEKALLSGGLLTLALILPPWPSAPAIGLVAVICASWGAGVPFAAFLRAMGAPAGFLLIGTLPLVISLNPESGLAFVGWQAAFGAFARAMAAASALLLLAFTTPASLLADGMRRLGLPGPLVDLVLLTYRQILLLFEVMTTMSLAQKARLGEMRRMASLGLLTARLFPRALARAEHMEIGLAIRALGGDLRTIPLSTPISPLRLGLILSGLISLGLLGGLA
jgi:cobalt/nickel transport system permease protein